MIVDARMRRFFGLCISLILVALSAIFLFVSFFPLAERLYPATALGSWIGSQGTGIKIAKRIYVVSLKARQDRRTQMDLLSARLGLRWAYVNAVPATDKRVNATLVWLEKTRMAMLRDPTLPSGFAWPIGIDSLVDSDTYLNDWDSTNAPNFDDRLDLESLSQATVYSAVGNSSLPPNSPQLPNHMILSPGRIACWHSHLGVIHHTANSALLQSGERQPMTTLVLEDDVDMEQDVDAQLSRLWTYLPLDWDIVFLGHCWSNESFHSALTAPMPHGVSISSIPSSTFPPRPVPEIHPSYSPKCTHAYALSRAGARRLLLHLRHPPFAYSRPIDQAMAWLIQTGRLKSFSIVPSLVIQRKVSKSDVWASAVSGNASDHAENNNTGSAWRDKLFDGVHGI